MLVPVAQASELVRSLRAATAEHISKLPPEHQPLVRMLKEMADAQSDATSGSGEGAQGGEPDEIVYSYR